MRNKIVVFVALAALVGLVLLSSCGKREIKNINSQGKNIICFGDSLTIGYGANAGEDYPAALGKLVNFPVINAGIDGDTTMEALRRLGTDVLERDPYLVVIEFSGNDFLRKIPMENTLANLRSMIEQSQAKGAMVAIVDVSAGLFLQEYRAAYRKLAAQTGCVFVPSVLSGIITNPSMKSDFLHPNAGGYKIIAERIYQAIKPYLK